MPCFYLWGVWIEVTLPGGSGVFIPSQGGGTNTAQLLMLPGALGGWIVPGSAEQPLPSLLCPETQGHRDFGFPAPPPEPRLALAVGVPGGVRDPLLQCWQEESSSASSGSGTRAAWPAGVRVS